MTFLNPFVLFGLAAAAIPILLHLLNKRKLRTVEFSSLAFLKELQKSTMRKITLRQWLLLLLRTLFVILVVLAFSRPVLRGSLSGFGSHAKTTIALIVDDSYSMSLQNQQGVYLKQARTAALRVLDLMKEGDDVLLVKLSDLPNPTVGTPIHDVGRIRTLLQDMTVGAKHRTIEDAIRLTSRLLAQSKNLNKEVYIFTDDQRSTFINEHQTEEPGVSQKLFDAQIKFFIVSLNDKPFENCGVERVTTASPLLQAGKPITVSATVKNFGTDPVGNRLVSLVLNGTRIMQKTVSLAPGTSSPVAFVFSPTRSGFQRCSIELEDDALDADNRYYFTLYVPERLTIALVSDDESQTPYITAALTALSNSGGSDANGFLAVRDVSPAQISSSSFDDADVILLCAVKNISRSGAETIAHAMQQGTGVLFFPGSSMDAAKWNADFFPVLDLPSLQPLPPSVSGDSGSTSVDRTDFDHPLFKGIFEQQPGNMLPQIESPRIFRQVRFASLQPLRPIMTTGNGNYFLWEKKFGRGSILGFSVAPVIEWSDFVVKPIFLPIFSQSMLYIGSIENAGQLPGVIGEQVDPRTILIPRFARTIQAAAPLRLFDPEKNETKFTVSSLDAKGAAALAGWLSENAEHPGLYTVTEGRDTLTVLGMNMSEAESEGAPIAAGEALSTINQYGGTASLLPPNSSIDTMVLQSRYGVELWKYFLIFALVIAVIEMLVARESHEKDERGVRS
jgi:hypothetical protein